MLGVLAATVVQGITSFSLTQLLSKAAQRLITELRQKVQAHVGRLSVSFHDSTKSGVLVSRIMSDVEGVRNLIGTGLVDLVGGLLTASIALVVLFRISSIMTLLATRMAWSFQDLKAELNMSDGNLITHLRTLHRLGLVAVTKEIRDRPQTSYALTAKGRAAFQEYLAVLEQIVKTGRK